jgi:hypothetical protein
MEFIRYYIILSNPLLCLVRVYSIFVRNAVMNFSIEKLLTFTVVIARKNVQNVVTYCSLALLRKSQRYDRQMR